MHLLFMYIFAFLLLSLPTTIYGAEKSDINPKGYTTYGAYAGDLEKNHDKLKNMDREKIVDYYEAHRTLMLAISFIKEEDGDLNTTCNVWYNKTIPKEQQEKFKSFDEVIYEYYNDMQDFYYSYVEDKLGTPKMGSKAKEFYDVAWNVYLHDFVGFIKKKEFVIADSSASPTAFSHFALIVIGIISAMGYYFTNL
uniref:Uncharacterized protein n=1 Tax=Panagrolaimus davidi TaxID=227884 RepID=A0A914PZP6_9BILA